MKASHPTLPGYRPLPASITGPVAEAVRRAEVLVHRGQLDPACRVLEGTLDTYDEGSELPNWLCGRLAAVYRALGRYADEVMLLERFRESQASDAARRRYDARLSKARVLAARARPGSQALASVRRAMDRPSRNQRSAAAPVQEKET